MRRTILVTTFISLAINTLSVGAAPTTNSTLHKRASGVSWNPSDAASQTFDYIVVGGGLTGITVAARLAENSATTVLVIEAGADDRYDERVYDIYAYTQAFGTSLDWQFPTDYGKQMVALVLKLTIVFLLLTYLLVERLLVEGLLSMEATGRVVWLPNTTPGLNSSRLVRPRSTGTGTPYSNT